MPTVNFVGVISSTYIDADEVSVTWAIVPGNSAWYLKRGVASGETHTCESSATSQNAIIGHPVDCQYTTSSSEGWPVVVCEVWERSEEGFRGFRACGSAWLPMSPGTHEIDLQLWKPSSGGLEGLCESFIPGVPDLTALRELSVSQFLRSQIQSESVGTLHLKITTILAGFQAHGVIPC